MRKMFTWELALPYVLLAAGGVGLLASIILTYDKIQVLQNPTYQPGCNINPILSCGSVMATEQASLFGLPNTIFGVAGFGMLIMFGLMLLAGTTARRWLWLAAQLAATLGVVFVHYLFYQSVFRISAICPWCFAVWMVTIPVFWGITLHNVRAGNIKLWPNVAAYISKHSGDILGLWYVALITILIVTFWYYWETLL